MIFAAEKLADYGSSWYSYIIKYAYTVSKTRQYFIISQASVHGVFKKIYLYKLYF